MKCCLYATTQKEMAKNGSNWWLIIKKGREMAENDESGDVFV